MTGTSFVDGGVTAPKGFQASGVHCGIKRRKKDIALLASKVECDAAAIYTTNRILAAPLIITHRNLSDGRAQGAVINSGLANALTGKRGLGDAEEMGRLASAAIGCEPEMMVVSSTGMIGKYLPMDKIRVGVESAHRAIGTSRRHARDAALAIMTTDTVPKEEAVVTKLKDGTRVTLGGMAKGSGMICPELKPWHATTLSFVTTDAAISADVLEEMLVASAEESLNMLNIDGDRSTNDMAVIFANGEAGNPKLKSPDPKLQQALTALMQSLTEQLARDGEGAKTLIEVRVMGARNLEQAKRAARSVVMSNLVKAAIFGEDPNFGRIVSAIGASGVDVDADTISLTLLSDYGEVSLMSKGELLALVDDKTYVQARQLLRSSKLIIKVDLGLGKGSAVSWGCDLTYDYVRINAEYTT